MLGYDMMLRSLPAFSFGLGCQGKGRQDQKKKEGEGSRSLFVVWDNGSQLSKKKRIHIICGNDEIDW